MRTFVALLLISTSVFAAPVWKKTGEKVETAKDAKQFQALKKKYPDMLRVFSGKNMTKLAVTTATWTFVGQHTCAPEDARLKWSARGVEYCDKQGAAIVCSKSQPLPPFGSNDPCEFGGFVE